jgi:hypothetical protein
MSEVARRELGRGRELMGEPANFWRPTSMLEMARLRTLRGAAAFRLGARPVVTEL